MYWALIVITGWTTLMRGREIFNTFSPKAGIEPRSRSVWDQSVRGTLTLRQSSPTVKEIDR